VVEGRHGQEANETAKMVSRHFFLPRHCAAVEGERAYPSLFSAPSASLVPPTTHPPLSTILPRFVIYAYERVAQVVCCTVTC